MGSLSDQNTVEEDEHSMKTSTPPPSLITTRSNGLYKGLLLAFTSGVIFSLCAVIVKFLKNIHPSQITMYRFIGITVLSLPLSVKTQEHLLGPRELRFMLFLRGIFGTTNIFLNYLAFRYLPLGEAAVIMYTVPVFVSIAAKIFLRERCGIVQSITVFITAVGMIFIVKVPTMLSGNSFNYTKEYIYGLAAAFSSLISFTVVFIVLRKLTGVHHSIIMLNFGWIGLIATSVLTVSTGHLSLPMCGLQQWLVILVGILSQVALGLFTIALQSENAGPVAVVRSASEVTLCFFWQIFFFRDYPDGFSIAGAVLLGVSIVLTGLGKWASSLPPHSAAAKYFRYIWT